MRAPLRLAVRRTPAPSRDRWSLRFASDTRGLAAIEFALIGSFLIYGLFNSIDLGRYLYAKMEVQDAAQMGAQAVWTACLAPNLPATTVCGGESAALTAGVQSTSLGSSVSVVSGYPTENWYCVNSSGALQNVAAIGSKPSDCTAASEPTYQPGDYFVVETTYTYAPLFPVLSAVGTLPTPITSTNYTRLQ